MVNRIRTGIRSAPQYVDINNDGVRDLIVGNYSGGIHYFSSKAVNVPEIIQDDNIFQMYPNPSNTEVTIECQNNFNIDKSEIQIIDITGKKIVIEVEKKNYNSWKIDVSTLSNGIYFLQILSANNEILKTFKLIKIQ